MKKTSYSKITVTFLLILYLLLILAFTINAITLSNQHERNEQEYITSLELEIKDTIDKNKHNTAMLREKLNAITETQSLEISLNSSEEVIYATVPFSDVYIKTGILNRNAIIYEAQGEYDTFDLWYAIYKPDTSSVTSTYLLRQTIFVGFGSLITLMLLYLLRNRLRAPLNQLKTAISAIRNYEFDRIDAGSDVINEELFEFSQELEHNISQVSQKYSQLEISLERKRERLANTITVSKSFIHDLKSPIYQLMLENELYLSRLKHPSQETTDIVNLNLSQNVRLMNRINEVLGILKESSFDNALTQEHFDVIPVFFEIIKGFKPIIMTKDVTLDYITHDTLFLTTNKAALQLLMHNLISNALNYATDHSEVSITITEEDHEVIFKFKNQSSPNNIKNMRLSENLFSKSQATLGNKYSSGNGLFLIKDLCMILNAQYNLNTDNDEICILIRLPKDGAYEIL
ncbi:HAMP domain-containing histidine kinase [Erysipelothrix sp. HDW6C]|uniref:sensor histidine kinase n=1 Tax=Erysipelothrix sp. HDW6C TaxID=2714930 RepID=UPI0014096111|nr:HAMP domain-containing sensor histidine kinase [Erysipelothrix sp. HDW6C]QIK70398.1 HAMP domain-containing histidine kinase [Erysipelothrix sp. HDW6C]